MQQQKVNIRKNASRTEEVATAYLDFLDRHLQNLIDGTETEMLELNQIAQQLFVSKQYLCEIMQDKYGNHPCHFYDQKILDIAKGQLRTTGLAIADIASQLTYDPSNFSKFFKKYVGITPGAYRKQHKS